MPLIFLKLESDTPSHNDNFACATKRKDESEQEKYRSDYESKYSGSRSYESPREGYSNSGGCLVRCVGSCRGSGVSRCNYCRT